MAHKLSFLLDLISQLFLHLGSRGAPTGLQESAALQLSEAEWRRKTNRKAMKATPQFNNARPALTPHLSLPFPFLATVCFLFANWAPLVASLYWALCAYPLNVAACRHGFLGGFLGHLKPSFQQARHRRDPHYPRPGSPQRPHENWPRRRHRGSYHE